MVSASYRDAVNGRKVFISGTFINNLKRGKTTEQLIEIRDDFLRRGLLPVSPSNTKALNVSRRNRAIASFLSQILGLRVFTVSQKQERTDILEIIDDQGRPIPQPEEEQVTTQTDPFLIGGITGSVSSKGEDTQEKDFETTGRTTLIAKMSQKLFTFEKNKTVILGTVDISLLPGVPRPFDLVFRAMFVDWLTNETRKKKQNFQANYFQNRRLFRSLFLHPLVCRHPS